jgi:hypothetical protein
MWRPSPPAEPVSSALAPRKSSTSWRPRPERPSRRCIPGSVPSTSSTSGWSAGRPMRSSPAILASYEAAGSLSIYELTEKPMTAWFTYLDAHPAALELLFSPDRSPAAQQIGHRVEEGIIDGLAAMIERAMRRTGRRAPAQARFLAAMMFGATLHASRLNARTQLLTTTTLRRSRRRSSTPASAAWTASSCDQHRVAGRPNYQRRSSRCRPTSGSPSTHRAATTFALRPSATHWRGCCGPERSLVRASSSTSAERSSSISGAAGQTGLTRVPGPGTRSSTYGRRRRP